MRWLRLQPSTSAFMLLRRVRAESGWSVISESIALSVGLYPSPAHPISTQTNNKHRIKYAKRLIVLQRYKKNRLCLHIAGFFYNRNSASNSS